VGNNNDHLYTTDPNEIGPTTIGGLGNHGYTCEGVLGYISQQPIPGTVPVYRYWNVNVSDHFYTTNADEIGTTQPGTSGKFGYVFESILGYAYP